MRKNLNRMIAILCCMAILGSETLYLSATESGEPRDAITTEESKEADGEDSVSEESSEAIGSLEEIDNLTDKSEKTEDICSEQELKYEDDSIRASAKGVLPTGCSLSVIPVEENLEEFIADAYGEDHSIIGYSAYDISIIDKEENEVTIDESISVSLEYKVSAVPQEICSELSEYDESNITVLHFEEDENGEVKEIVDMKESGQIQNIETTEDNEIQKIEFVTDSFSKFVLIWKSSNIELDAMCVDTTGNPVNAYERDKFGNLITDENGDYKVIDIVRCISAAKDVYLPSLNIAIQGYNYIGAYIVSGGSTINNIERITYDEAASKWQYKVAGSTTFQNLNSGTLYLKYEEMKGNPVSKLETIDARKEGISINLFNYNQDINTNNKNFQFVGSSYGIDTEIGTQGGGTGVSSDGFKQNIVKRNLLNNYPVLSYDNASLGYLFNPEAIGVTESYTGLDGMFQKDNDGYYFYNSKVAHAQLNVESNSIDVYNAMLFSSNSKVNYGNFLPFNKLPSGAVDGGLYSLPNNTADYWFGLNIVMSFYQPEGGTVVNGEPMQFEFDGDDDMWVFVDDVLILDIGGMHGYLSGSINYKNGEVKVNSPNGKHANTKNPDYASDGGKTPVTYIGEQFEEAYKQASEDGETLSAENINKLNEIFNKEVIDGVETYTSFKDYTEHTMRVFYFERGTAESNCYMRFNMPPLETTDVIVEKEISNYDKGAFNDVEFSFNMHVKNKNISNPELSDTEFNLLPEGTQYTLIKADGTEETKEIGVNGIFKLKHKEKAVFEELTRGSEYYVEEIDISSTTYDVVSIVSSEITDEDDEIISSKDVNHEDNIIGEGEYSVRTVDLVVGVDSLVKFSNECAETNMRHLIIEKNVRGMDDPAEYTVKVSVGGEVYIGGYKIGSSYDDAIAAQELTTDNGIITMKKDQVAVILGNATASSGKRGIPSETSFKVEEILDETKYKAPEFAVTADTADDEVLVNGFSGYAYGKIKLDADAQVTITNEIKPVSISITKRIGNYNKDVERSVFWYEVKGPNGYKEQVKVIFTADETDLLGYDKSGKTVTITNLYPGDYTVRELPVVGYDLIQAELTEAAAPSEDAEKIPFTTELEDSIFSGETGTYYFWNNFKEITQRYSIKNAIRFDENGDIVLSNSRNM